MRLRRTWAIAAIAVITAMVAVGCGSDDESSGSSDKAITIGSFNFGESEILAHLYAGVLEDAGITTTVRAKLGSREVVEPALESGEIDLVPEYIGTTLEFLNKNAGEASGDASATWNKLKETYKPKNITTLEFSSAADQNAFAVTKETATKHNLKKMSDLAPVASQLTLGGPPECPTRPFCQPGLEKTYGLKFSKFTALDPGGPLTKSALDSGAIDVGLLFSSDGSIAAKGYVVLEDDKKLQTADNIVPVIRNDKLDDDVEEALNKVSTALTTDKLAALNKKVDVDKEDPAAVADQFLKDEKLT